MTVKDSWYKVLAVLLIVYSIIAGFLTPLGPGIIAVSPDRVRHGQEAEISITGYNSRYAPGALRVWLRLDDQHTLEAAEVKVQDERHATARFLLPLRVPSADTIHPLNLILYSEADGHSILPSAVFLTGNDAAAPIGDAWTAEVIQSSGPVSRHFPFRNILAETIRNTYYHVPLWLAMMLIFGISMYHAISYLRNRSPLSDHRSVAFASVGTLLGMLGILTGAVWAKNTWGAYWSFDVKQNMAAIAMLIYAAYFILRSAIMDRDVARRFSAAYNIFAFILLIPLLYIIPRMTDSLHPGSGGNPAFSTDDMDHTMRMVFYPAVVGWFLFGVWISNVYWRFLRLEARSD